MPSPRRCLFFDRDGVVNEPPANYYLTYWADFHFREGIRDVLRLVRTKGYLRILITNQKGVAKGLMTLAQLEEIHGQMQRALGEEAFEAIFAATDDGGPGSPRKPSPAMLLEAAVRYEIDLGQSWMIGDDDRDMLAGQAAGARTIRLLGEKEASVASDFTVHDHAELLALLRRLLA